MPRYDFECGKCHHVYEEFATYDETNKYKKVSCPKCKSKKKTKLILGCGYNFSNPVGTDRWNSDSKGHDYRFYHNLPKAQKERQIAEEKSHMGGSGEIYNTINDLDNDSTWGEVK